MGLHCACVCVCLLVCLDRPLTIVSTFKYVTKIACPHIHQLSWWPLPQCSIKSDWLQRRLKLNAYAAHTTTSRYYTVSLPATLQGRLRVIDGKIHVAEFAAPCTNDISLFIHGRNSPAS